MSSVALLDLNRTGLYQAYEIGDDKRKKMWPAMNAFLGQSLYVGREAGKRSSML